MFLSLSFCLSEEKGFSPQPENEVRNPRHHGAENGAMKKFVREGPAVLHRSWTYGVCRPGHASLPHSCLRSTWPVPLLDHVASRPQELSARWYESCLQQCLSSPPLFSTPTHALTHTQAVGIHPEVEIHTSRRTPHACIHGDEASGDRAHVRERFYVLLPFFSRYSNKERDLADASVP